MDSLKKYEKLRGLMGKPEYKKKNQKPWLSGGKNARICKSVQRKSAGTTVDA
jgi:hypothetical protein